MTARPKLDEALGRDCPTCHVPASGLCRDLRDPDLERPARYMHRERAGHSGMAQTTKSKP